MKLARSIILILLCVAFVPSIVLGQTAEIDALKEKAEKGNKISQYNIGVKYLLGKDIAKDKVAAFKWFKKSAEQGFVLAQAQVGQCYNFGDGTPINYSEALKWYLKAAIKGNSNAQYNLGVMYDKGRGVTENDVEAVKLYRKAANQGKANAQYALGRMYIRGEGIPEDKAEAFKWFSRSAEQGNLDSQHELGNCYILGRGVSQNISKAYKWWSIAANRGYANSQYNLGRMYFIGQGTPQNYIKSYKWLILAAAQGDKKYIKELETLSKSLTRQQIADAQKLAADFKQQKETSSSKTIIKEFENFENSNPDAFGSGFYVSSNGYLLTNQHVVNGARKVFVYSGSQRLPAQVVKTDAANDLALLKVSGTFAALPVSSSRRVKLGQTVSTVGFPNPDLQGKSPKLTKGEISSLSGASDDPKYFQISVPVQPGNSGGPLVDGYGNVVGVVTAKLSTKAALATAGTLPENVNYAVKGTFVMGFLESVPEVAQEMLDPNPRRSREFTDVVSEAEKSSVMILVYE